MFKAYCIRNIKKIFLNILVIVFLLQALWLPSYASDTQNIVSSKQDIDFLNRLGIIASWSESQGITRAEFINAAVRCIVKDSGAKDRSNLINWNEDVFDDVKSDYWASYNIAVAKKQGIIVGGFENKFNPDANLTLDAAVKIAVEALGYLPVAKSYGGFPTGHYVTAEKIDLIYSAKNRAALTKGEAATILRSMLESVPMENAYTDKEVISKFPDNDDDTLLNINFSVRSFEGVVVSNEYSSYDSVVSQGKGMVKIRSLSNGNTGVFEEGETKASEYLGRNINVYYYDAKPYKLFHTEVSGYEECVRIDGNSIVEASFEDREIKFETVEIKNKWEDEKLSKKVKIPIDINIIHNGIFSSDIKRVFDIIEGVNDENIYTIDLYDNDFDGRFDLMNVVSYFTIYADYVNDNSLTLAISDSYTNKSINIDKTNTDIKVLRYNQDGIKMPNVGIIEGLVVSVAYAEGDIELYNLYITKDNMVSVVEAVSDNKVLTKEHIYNVSNTVKQRFNVETSEFDKLSLSEIFNIGDEYTLYFDNNKNIVRFTHIDPGYDTYYKMVKNKDDYIYIIDIFENPERPSEFMVDAATLEGEIKNLVVSQHFRIDDKKVAMRGNTGISKQEAISMIKGKLVLYKLDEEGKLKSVTLPKEAGSDNVFSYCEGVSQADGPVYLKHRAGPHAFFDKELGSAIINSKTTVLWVPHNDLVEKGVDYSLYCKRGVIGDFKSDQKYYINAYKTKASSVVADILVAYDNGASKITSFSRPIIVSKVVNAINKNGNYSQKLYGYQDTKEVEICSTDVKFKDKSGAFLDISTGDIVRCDLDAKGDCIIADIKFDYDNPEDDTGGFAQTYRVARGSVYYKDSTAFYFIVNNWDVTDEDIIPKNLECQLCTSSVKFIEVDVENETVKKVTGANLVGYKFDQKNYSRVVIANSYGSADLVVIYK